MPRRDAYDVLLTWVSELGSGTYKQFADGCRHLGLAPGAAAWALSQLAHVEWDWDSSRFSAAASCLVSIPGLPGRLLLTGARPAGLLRELDDLISTADIDAELHDPVMQDRGPGTVLLQINPSDALYLADAAGIPLADQAASNLGQLLPHARLEEVSETAWPDDRFPHCLIDPFDFRPRWADPDIPEDTSGLWRWETHGRRSETWLLHEGEWRRLVAPEWGPYLLDRDPDLDPLITYEPAESKLLVHRRARLPALHARAACLCSGRMPADVPTAVDAGIDQYVNVPADLAKAIATTLNQAPA